MNTQLPFFPLFPLFLFTFIYYSHQWLFILHSLYRDTVAPGHLSPLYQDWGEPPYLLLTTLSLTVPSSLRYHLGTHILIESASYPAVISGYKKNKLHPRYLFHLQNIRFKLQIPSLIQSFILKNATLIFLNPSMTAGRLLKAATHIA